LKLLFDIFHVQAMDGDLVRRIHQLKEYIGHVHTAGNPGRNELDENQEINYVPVMKALVEIGYSGFVGHEFMPTRDPLVGLRQAVTLCDV
jgi:hydroxypyruvate isomerase